MLSKLRKWWYYFLQIPLYWLSRWVPSRRRLWVFGAWQGERYADNSRYLFEYVVRHHPEIEAVWFSANPALIDELRQKGRSAVRINSLRAFWLALRAEVAVVTHSLRTDIQPLIHPRKTSTVQLWHGIPLKKIGYDDTKFTHPTGQSLLQRLKARMREILFPFWQEQYALIATTSQNLVPIFASAFRHPETRVRVTGYPRNDALFHPEAPSPVPSGERAVIYMPTFRGGMGTESDLFTPYGFSITDAEAVLARHKAHLFLRLHPVNRPPLEIQQAIARSTRIHFFNEGDIYSRLAYFDVLITDFSSVYFDFLLLNRPIIFAPFDLDAYLQRDRELYFDYDEVTPGPKVFDWKALLAVLESTLVGQDPYREARAAVLQRFHDYQDDHSSERVVREILRLL